MADEIQVTGTETAAVSSAPNTEVADPAVDAGAGAGTGEAGAATTETGEENPYLIQEEEAPAAAEVTTEAQPNEALKSYFEISPYITNEAQLQGAVSDSHLLWDVINGQVPAGNILANLEQSNQPAWQNIVNGLAQYIQEKTGYRFVDPQSMPQADGTGTPDPVQQKLTALEQKFKDQETAREQAILTQRIDKARGALVNKITELQKGSFLEGEDLMPFLGAKLGDPQKLAGLIEAGDWKSIEAAYKAVKTDLTALYNRIAKNVAKQRTAVSKSLPGVDNPNGAAKKKTEQQFDLSTPAGRIAWMNTQ